MNDTIETILGGTLLTIIALLVTLIIISAIGIAVGGPLYLLFLAIKSGDVILGIIALVMAVILWR